MVDRYVGAVNLNFLPVAAVVARWNFKFRTEKHGLVIVPRFRSSLDDLGIGA
jgi:hypothetical protein